MAQGLLSCALLAFWCLLFNACNYSGFRLITLCLFFVGKLDSNICWACISNVLLTFNFLNVDCFLCDKGRCFMEKNNDVLYKCERSIILSRVVFPPYPPRVLIIWKVKIKVAFLPFLLFFIWGDKNKASIDEVVYLSSLWGLYFDIILCRGC